MKSYQVLRRFVFSEWGGIETVVLSLARALLAAGDETEIVCTSALDRTGREDVDGLTIRRLPYSYLRFPLTARDRAALDRKAGNPFVPALFRSIVTDRDLQLVSCHTMARMGATVRAACRVRGIPYVVTLHGGHFHIPPGEQAVLREPARRSVDLGRPLDVLLGARRFLDDAAAILCLGREEYAAARERHPHVRAELLPNGVDTAYFAGASAGESLGFRTRYGIPPDAPLALCVARIDPQKGQDVLVEATARLASRLPWLHVALVGPVTVPRYGEQLDNAIAKAGLSSRVHRIGPLRFADPQLVAAYRAADVFVLPSRHEPFGVVLLEAWAAGRPVIASRVGGVPDFVEHGRTGVLVPPEDPDALAAELAALLTDPTRARALAEAGRKEARDRYDWSAVAGQVRDVYGEAVERAGKR